MRRSGITLLEVLSAIFITGIGLLSLLTLFPLGALKMAEAVRDDRCALAGGNGIAIANAVGMRGDPEVFAAMIGQLPLPGRALPSADGPGYPVLVDPIGVFGYLTLANKQWVAGDTIGIPRVQGQWLRAIPPAPLPNPPVVPIYPGEASIVPALLRWCTVQDDINFVSDGDFPGQAQEFPVYAGGLSNVQRNLRYSFAWMMRMPRAGSPSVVDVSVLVFSGRSIDLVGLETQERLYDATFVPALNQINIAPVNGEPASLRRGQWILDGSVVANPAAAGFFYRIVSVSDPDAGGFVTVEVQTPLRAWGTGGGVGRVVIFDNLVEVFDDGTF